MGNLGAAEYLGHQLLTHHQNQRGLVPKTVFHKLWCISDHHLIENYDIEVGVPRYWYMYGETVDEQSSNDEFFVGPTAPWGGQAYKPVWELEPSDFDVTEEEREYIDSAVSWTLQRFKRRHTRYLENYQYQLYAPNDFIRAYSELREYFQHGDLENQQVIPSTIESSQGIESNEELVRAYLDEMVITYPDNDNDYAQLHKLFLRWDDTARLILDNRDGFDELEDFLDEFIEALSKGVLKLKYNTQIREERLQKWEQEAEDEILSFKTKLESKRTELLKNRGMSGVLESIGETYDETVIGDFRE